jgi:hypothetical protein
VDGKTDNAIKKVINMLDNIPIGYIIGSRVKDNPSMEVKMKEQIKWNAANGKQITVTVALQLKETIYADGDNVEVDCCKMHIDAVVEDMGTMATSAPRKSNKLPAGFVAIMGSKLVLSQENYDRVMAAIAKLEATPQWQAKVAAQKQADKSEQEYEAHRAKMAKIMGY